MSKDEKQETAVCWRCKRRRPLERLKGTKQSSGRTSWRCKARSVCASKARRLKEKKARDRAALEA